MTTFVGIIIGAFYFGLIMVLLRITFGYLLGYLDNFELFHKIIKLFTLFYIPLPKSGYGSYSIYGFVLGIIPVKLESINSPWDYSIKEAKEISVKYCFRKLDYKLA